MIKTKPPPAPSKGGVWTLRGCLVAPFTIHFAPLGGSRQGIVFHVNLQGCNRTFLDVPLGLLGSIVGKLVVSPSLYMVYGILGLQKPTDPITFDPNFPGHPSPLVKDQLVCGLVSAIGGVKAQLDPGNAPESHWEWQLPKENIQPGKRT